eukprot:m.101837 g.101837  ORF g.101837 m.101837 type:complete len:78 (+) comp13209_c0_seq4:238-471(+)
MHLHINEPNRTRRKNSRQKLFAQKLTAAIDFTLVVTTNNCVSLCTSLEFGRLRCNSLEFQNSLFSFGGNQEHCRLLR